MLRIIVSCKTLFKGGAEKQALILSKLLTEKKIYVLLINWYRDRIDPDYMKYIENNAIQYTELDGSLFKKFFSFLKIIRDEKINMILSYLTLANFISGMARIVTREVVTIGGIRNERLPYYKFVVERMVHNMLNNATVFNNYSAKEKFVKRGFKSDNIYVIHNAFENNDNGKPLNDVRSDIRILTVARFVDQKDFKTAIYSFKKLVERNRNREVNYWIIGYGPLEKEIRSMSEILNIFDRIKIYIAPPNILEIMKDCDIYLSTSLFEGLSNSIMEAMAVGLPIVATDVGDNRYLIKDGSNGYLVDCKDINTIAERLDYLVESEELRRSFGNNSQAKITNEFSQDKMLNSYLNLFSEFFKS